MFEFKLCKIQGIWVIISSKDQMMHILHRAYSLEDAKEKAHAWISSWNGASLKVEDEYKQDEERD